MEDTSIEQPLGNGTTDVPQSPQANEGVNEASATAAGYPVQHDYSGVKLDMGKSTPVQSTPVQSGVSNVKLDMSKSVPIQTTKPTQANTASGPEYGSDEWYAGKLLNNRVGDALAWFNNKVLAPKAKYLAGAVASAQKTAGDITIAATTDVHAKNVAEGKKEETAPWTQFGQSAVGGRAVAGQKSQTTQQVPIISKEDEARAEKEYPVRVAAAKAVSGFVAGIAADPTMWPLMAAPEIT